MTEVLPPDRRSAPRRRLLSGGQLAMLGTLLLLAGALAAVVVLAYNNLNTSTAIQAGYVITDISNVQREIIQLHMVTNRILRDRSKNFEPIEIQRGHVDKHLTISIIEAEGDADMSAGLRRIENLLAQYDYEVMNLSRNPTEIQFRSSANQFDNILDLMEKQIQAIYGNEEQRFFHDISDALKVQRTSQILTIVIGALLLISGVVFTLSIGRSVSGKFRRAYDLLKAEVTERRRAEDELRRQNVYLGALHDTTLALMNRLDVADLLTEIVTRAGALMDTPHGYVYLLNPAKGLLERRVGTGMFAQELGFGVHQGQGLAGRVWTSGEPLVVENYNTWPGRMPTPGIRGARIGSIMGVPLKSGTDTIGVIGLARESDDNTPFSEGQVVLLEGFAQLASIALDNAQLFSQAELRAVQIEALYRADEELYRHLDMTDVLESLIEVTVDILKVDKAALLVWDAEHTTLVPHTARGFKAETLERMHFAPGEGMIGRVAQTGEPNMVRDTTSDSRVDWNITYPERIRSFIHVPVLVADDIFGVFSVNYTQPFAFTDEDVRLVLALAQRAASAIENARLYEQAQQAATLEERQRLARELHDAVTQTLFSASIIADILPRMWERDKEEAAVRLTELRDLTRGALAEMRALLLELRPTTLAASTMTELLRQLGDAHTGHTRVPVNIDATANCDIPGDIKIALYRIAQEALNNVAKHAEATQVFIYLRCDEDKTEMTIHDNGVGYDMQHLTVENMGLRIMRERADGIGAQLSMRSAPGMGTEVHVLWREGIDIKPEADTNLRNPLPHLRPL